MSSMLLVLSQHLGQAHYGEEDVCFQKHGVKENHCDHPKEILLELLQRRQEITWNIRFRWCLWIMRKIENSYVTLDQNRVCKKRKRLENTSIYDGQEKDIKNMLLLVLEGIYSDLRMSSVQAQDTQKLWRDDAMLRNWLVPLQKNDDKRKKILFLDNKQFRIGTSRFLCIKDLKHKFKIDDNIDVNIRNISSLASTLRLFKKRESWRKEFEISEQKINDGIEYPLKLIIKSIDLFVVTHYYKILNNCTEQKKKLQHYDQKIKNLSESIYSSPLLNKFDYISPNRKVRNTDGSFFQRHICEISGKYAMSFQERLKLESEMKNALKTASGKHYLECFTHRLLILDVNTNVLGEETSEFSSSQTQFIRGKALLISFLINLLTENYCEPETLGKGITFKELLSFLRPSPIPSFFGMNKDDFSNLGLGQSNVVSDNQNLSETCTSTDLDRKNSSINHEHLDGTLQSALFQSKADQLLFKRNAHPISKPRLEFCIESFLNGTKKSMKQNVLMNWDEIPIFEGFGPLEFSNILTNDCPHVPDVSELTNHLFDVLIHTSIASSSTDIDSVVYDNGSTQDDVDSILHMAKAFGKWFPLDLIVIKFQILLYVLLTYGKIDICNMIRIHEFVNNSPDLPYSKKTELCHWSHGLSQRINGISLSSKVKLLIHVMTFFEHVHESTHIMADKHKILQNGHDTHFLINKGQLWHYILNNLFCTNLLLNVAWECDLAVSKMNTMDSNKNELYKSAFASKLLFYNFIKTILTSKEKYNQFSGTRKDQASNGYQYIQNLSWLLYSMSAFPPHCVEIMEAVENNQNIFFYKKVYKLNERINNFYIMLRQSIATPNNKSTQQIFFRSDYKSNLTYVGALTDKEIPPFDVFSKHIILFALTSAWKQERSITWCNYIGENIIVDVYLSKNERSLSSEDYSSSYCMLRTWLKQIINTLLAKTSSRNDRDTEDKLSFSSLLKSLHSSVLRNIFQRIENNCPCPKKSHNAVRHQICIAMILMEIKSIDIVPNFRKMQVLVPLLKEILCNTETSFLFRSICLSSQDVLYNHPCIHETVKELLQILGNSLTCTVHLLVGVGLLIDNKLERTINTRPTNEDSGLKQSSNSQTIFRLTSSIIDYIGENENYSNQDWTWSFLSKTVYLKLKSKHASFGMDWWAGVIKEINNEVIQSLKSDDNVSLSDVSIEIPGGNQCEVNLSLGISSQKKPLSSISKSNESQSNGDPSHLSNEKSSSSNVKSNLVDELNPPHSINEQYEEIENESSIQRNISLEGFLKSQTRSSLPKDIHQGIAENQLNQEIRKTQTNERNTSDLYDSVNIKSSNKGQEFFKEEGTQNWFDDRNEGASDDEILLLSM